MVPLCATHDGVTLTDDQLLEALAAGDIVIAFEGRRPSRPLVALARSLAAPFMPRSPPRARRWCSIGSGAPVA